MIGIASQGFVSLGWVGRASDKCVTSKVWFHQVPGDIIMSDRGFNIDEQIATIGANVKAAKW